MTLEQFKEIEDLKKEIEKSNYKISDLNKLIETTDFSCVIESNTNDKRVKIKHYVNDPEIVLNILRKEWNEEMDKRSDLLIKFDSINIVTP